MIFTLLFGAGCGISVQPLEAFDVTLNPTQDCTLTGSTSRDCTDAAQLALQQTTGRWIFEQEPAQSFTLTTEEGITLPGIIFNDDGLVLNQDPCLGAGAGAICYFARRKFESVDARNNNCTRFAELVAIVRRVDDGNFAGVLSDTQGADQSCGTSTVIQRIDNVAGKKAPEPSLAREEVPAP